MSWFGGKSVARCHADVRIVGKETVYAGFEEQPDFTLRIAERIGFAAVLQIHRQKAVFGAECSSPGFIGFASMPESLSRRPLPLDGSAVA